MPVTLRLLEVTVKDLDIFFSFMFFVRFCDPNPVLNMFIRERIIGFGLGFHSCFDLGQGPP